MSTATVVLSSPSPFPAYVTEDTSRKSIVLANYVQQDPAVLPPGQQRILATAGFAVNPATAPTTKIYQL